MNKHIILAILLSCGANDTLWAKDCPFEPGTDYVQKVDAAIKSTQDCATGVALAESCGVGSTMDTQIAVVAERKCGLDFWHKLSNAEKKVYTGLQQKCEQKFAHTEGSMSVSATAFCRLQVAKLYSTLYSPAEY